MRNKRLLEYIPFYPKAVSEYFLAIKAGYVKSPFKNVERGMKAFRRDLMWLSLRHEELVQRTEKLQVSTEKHLKDEGFPIPEDEEVIYLSRYKTEGQR
jgi:hypothetical protein